MGRDKCDSCGTKWEDHHGIQKTCRELYEALALIEFARDVVNMARVHVGKRVSRGEVPAKHTRQHDLMRELIATFDEMEKRQLMGIKLTKKGKQ